MFNFQKWFRVALFNFVVAAAMGLLLRYAAIYPIAGLNLGNLLHGHSHVAMMGWVYTMLTSTVMYSQLTERLANAQVLSGLFTVNQVAIFGVMISFPLQGYALFSIFFSSLHLLCTYVFALIFSNEERRKGSSNNYLAKIAVRFMVLSSLGIWALAPISIFAGKESSLFQLSVQFFLHFQFNGWFIIGVMSAIVYSLGVKMDNENLSSFYKMLLLSVVLTFAEPFSWYVDGLFTRVLYVAGLIFQLITVLYFLLLVYLQAYWRYISRLERLMLWFALCCLAIKTIVPIVLLLPSLLPHAQEIRPLFIGFIHLLVLGSVSASLFFFAMRSRWVLRKSANVMIGCILFVFSFVATEACLLYQGLAIAKGLPLLPDYYEWMFGFSVVLFLSVLLFYIASLTKIETLEQAVKVEIEQYKKIFSTMEANRLLSEGEKDEG